MPLQAAWEAETSVERENVLSQQCGPTQLITSEGAGAIRACFHPHAPAPDASWARCLPGGMQERALPEMGEHPGPLPRLAAMPEAMGWWWKPTFCHQTCPGACWCLLKEDGARHWDPQQPVALPEMLQALRYSGCPEAGGQAGAGRCRWFPEADAVSTHRFPITARHSVWPTLGSITHLQPRMGVPALPWPPSTMVAPCPSLSCLVQPPRSPDRGLGPCSLNRGQCGLPPPSLPPPSPRPLAGHVCRSLSPARRTRSSHKSSPAAQGSAKLSLPPKFMEKQVPASRAQHNSEVEQAVPAGCRKGSCSILPDSPSLPHPQAVTFGGLWTDTALHSPSTCGTACLPPSHSPGNPWAHPKTQI